MLDAIECHDGTQAGSCYQNTLAMSVGVAITPTGKLLSYDLTANSKGFKFWRNSSDLNQIIAASLDQWSSLNSAAFDLITATTSNLHTGIDIYYTSEFATSYSLNADFGIGNTSELNCNYVNENMNSTNVCALLNMRLPRYEETSGNYNPSYTNTCTRTPDNTNGIQASNYILTASSVGGAYPHAYWLGRYTNNDTTIGNKLNVYKAVCVSE